MKRRTISAFTLLELIVALAITAVIGILSLNFMQGALQVWSDADRNLSMEMEVNAALDLIALDFESAFFSEGEGNMLAATVLHDHKNSGKWVNSGIQVTRPSANSFSPNNYPLNDPRNHRYGWAGTWLRFYTAAPALNAVSYQIVRRELMTSATDPGYRLYRSIVRLDHTVDNGYDITQNDYAGGGASFLGHAGEVLSPNIMNLVASNVIDFGVRFYVYDSGAPKNSLVPPGLRIIFPADPGNIVSSTDDDHLASTFSSEKPSIQYPDVVEIVMRVIDYEGAEKLFELEMNGSNQALWYEIVNNHSKLYQRFVEVKGGSW